MLSALPEVQALDRLLDAADGLIGADFRRLSAEGTSSELADTRVAQPLLYLVDWAWGTLLLDAGVNPVAVAGHSLGELAALAVAGVYSAEAGLELVCERSRLMAEAAAANPGAMAAVLGMSRQAVDDAISHVHDVWLANDNSPGQIVISGRLEAVQAAADALRDVGARRVVLLEVSGGFHSPLMYEAALRFSEILNAAEFRDARMPVVQNARPTPATDATEIKRALSAQMESPVRWTETMQTLSTWAPLTLVEAGPGAVLTGLARRMADIKAVDVESAGVERILQEVLA